MQYTAVVKNDHDCWYGWIEEVPGVNCQEESYNELIETLKITLKEAIDFYRHDAIVAAGSDYREEIIAV